MAIEFSLPRLLQGRWSFKSLYLGLASMQGSGEGPENIHPGSVLTEAYAV
jgi:hypothetical protein